MCAEWVHHMLQDALQLTDRFMSSAGQVFGPFGNADSVRRVREIVLMVCCSFLLGLGWISCPFQHHAILNMHCLHPSFHEICSRTVEYSSLYARQ